MSERPEISVVVPLYDEEENVRPLVEAVRAALGEGATWELILVDDGSEDGTAETLREVAAGDDRVRPRYLLRNYGQSTAMQAGFDAAGGKVIVTMDGDLQNDPRDIPRLVEKLREGYDLVAGYREDRKDDLLTRRVPSWAANALIRVLTGVPIRDNGCSLKAYRRSVVKRMSLYSDLHRFLPAVAAATESERIVEVPVRHHPRLRGRSKYGLSRVWKVAADLLTITMIRWFRQRPLLLFGGASIGVALAAVPFGVRAVHWITRPGPTAPSDYVVLPAAALLLLGLAMWLMMLGLIAEVAVLRTREQDDSDGPPLRAAP